MSGGIAIYEKHLNESQFRPVAIQVLASGALRPKEAIEYLGKFPNCFVANDNIKKIITFAPRNDKNRCCSAHRQKNISASRKI